MPIPPRPAHDSYVQPGDTLSAIALYRCGCTLEAAAVNGIADRAACRPANHWLSVKTTGTANLPTPDSEVV
jgi:hypothetical protein